MENLGQAVLVNLVAEIREDLHLQQVMGFSQNELLLMASVLSDSTVEFHLRLPRVLLRLQMHSPCVRGTWQRLCCGTCSSSTRVGSSDSSSSSSTSSNPEGQGRVG
jgi:hypothetical protein